jgi:hypothetical protein
MKLYITCVFRHARLARATIVEKGLVDHVKIVGAENTLPR